MAKTQGRRGSDPEGPKLASRSELNALLTKLARRHPFVEGEDEIERYEAIRASLQKVDREKLQALVRRAFSDSLKSPSQKLGTARPPSRGATPGKKAKPSTSGKDSPRRRGQGSKRRKKS
jgi:hypothetical protein